MVESKETDKQVEEETANDEKAEEIKKDGSTNDEKLAKTEKEDEEGGKDDGESSDEELGSLEKPVVILYTARERKSVEVYKDQKKEQKKTHYSNLDYSKGKGVKLGDIPIITHNLYRADTEDLQVLHRMMYRKKGKKHNTKKNIREFCGWPFDKDSKEYRSVKENIIDRLISTALKWNNNLLGLVNSGDKETMIDALCEFLLKPVQNEKEVPTKKKSGGGSKRGSSGKNSAAKGKSKSTPKSKGKVKDSEDDVSEASDVESGSEEEEEKEAKPKKKTPQAKKSPKKKTKATPVKSKPKKKSKESEDEVSDVSEASDDSESEEEEKEEKPKKETPNAKQSPKKKATPVSASGKKSKNTPKKRKPEASGDSSEDEEPEPKKSKALPTDAELKNVVSGILKDADLEQVTMKSVFVQISEMYSSVDLSSRKDFIKATVRSLIS